MRYPPRQQTVETYKRQYINWGIIWKPGIMREKGKTSICLRISPNRQRSRHQQRGPHKITPRRANRLERKTERGWNEGAVRKRKIRDKEKWCSGFRSWNAGALFASQNSSIFWQSRGQSRVWGMETAAEEYITGNGPILTDRAVFHYPASSSRYKTNPNPSPIGIRFGFRCFGGDCWTRTSDLLRVKRLGGLKIIANSRFFSGFGYDTGT